MRSGEEQRATGRWGLHDPALFAAANRVLAEEGGAGVGMAVRAVMGGHHGHRGGRESDAGVEAQESASGVRPL